jgi:hypothetical protein
VALIEGSPVFLQASASGDPETGELHRIPSSSQV